MRRLQPIWVDTPEGVREVARSVTRARTLYLDTEFHRERTYVPEFALLQIHDGQRCWLVDPLACDLTPVWDALAQAPACKVFHAARQDLEIILHHAGFLPRPIFDTQIAAALAGFGVQVGLAELVRRITKHEMPKQAAFLDWRRRPLPEAQRRYAAEDVIRLAPVHRWLADRLRALGRLGWLEEEQAPLLDTRSYRPDPAALVWRVKGAGKLKGTALGALAALVAWREAKAQALNLPRRQVLPDEAMIVLAQAEHLDARQLPIARWMRDRDWQRFAPEIVEAWRQGRQMPPDARPQPRPRARHAPGTGARKDFLTAFVRIRAEEAKIAAPILASPEELAELASWAARPDGQPPALRVLQGWRREIVGDDLLRLARGEAVLALDPRTRLPCVRFGKPA